MTNSHLIGLVTFGASALFALVAWVVSNKHPDVRNNPSMRRRTRRAALFLLVFGGAFGYFAFYLDNGLRVTTLHEAMLAGTVGAAAGSPAPERTITFTVEHPGVRHELSLDPISDVFQTPESDVDISFSLHGPSGKAILPARTERFAVREASRGERANWYGETFSFIPSDAGLHTLQVKPLTTGIPRIHMRIEDPMKRDGERMSGY